MTGRGAVIKKLCGKFVGAEKKVPRIHKNSYNRFTNGNEITDMRQRRCLHTGNHSREREKKIVEKLKTLNIYVIQFKG